MTTESVVPEVLHAWAIYLRATEEARRRGDRRTGTDHVLLALLEDPSIEVVLGVSLQQAREALESLDREALGALGLGSGTDAPPLPMRAVPKKPRIRDIVKKDRFRMTPAAKKVLEEAYKPKSSEAPGHGPAGAGPDPHSPTARSCGGVAGRSRRRSRGRAATSRRGTRCSVGKPAPSSEGRKRVAEAAMWCVGDETRCACPAVRQAGARSARDPATSRTPPRRPAG